MNKNPKIILLGDVSVGKTAIIQTLINGIFPQKLVSTLGACFQRYECQTEDGPINVDIWDTAGQQKYRSLLTLYYKSCDGIILVFDITNKKSLDAMWYWSDQITEHCQEEPCILMVGNKYDLKDNGEMISHETIAAHARTLNWKLMYCSAKQNMNIQKIFIDLCTSIKRSGIRKKTRPDGSKIKKKKERKEESGCC